MHHAMPIGMQWHLPSSSCLTVMAGRQSFSSFKMLKHIVPGQTGQKRRTQNVKFNYQMDTHWGETKVGQICTLAAVNMNENKMSRTARKDETLDGYSSGNSIITL